MTGQSFNNQPNSPLSEKLVQDGFHSYLKSSLAQAKAEKLIDVDLLASAEADLMITAPALCLYFAALRSTTNPPSVPLPLSSKSSTPLQLSYENCPLPFISFLHVWANTVPAIQSFPPEQQHDLARIICGLDPLHAGSPSAVNSIAADLRAVAIEISQRRSFQDRFASDLQAALDAGNAPGTASPKKASFVPPPQYDPTPPQSPPLAPIRTSLESGYGGRSTLLPPQAPGLLSPYSPALSPAHSRSSSLSSVSSISSTSSNPSILTQDTPAIDFIRETLYASLADVFEWKPSIQRLLKRDPPRAYFASVAFAILDVATNAVTPDGAVIGVLGKPLTVADCPPELRPFMTELAMIGKQAREIEDEDTETAIQFAQEGKEVPLTRLDRVRMILEEGIGNDSGREAREGRRSVRGRAVMFANRINALSLGMTKLKAFRERQENVFKVLAGIS